MAQVPADGTVWGARAPPNVLRAVVLPAMTRLRETIKHLRWADEAYSESLGIKRIRQRQQRQTHHCHLF